MKVKILSVFIAIVLCTSLVSCGGASSSTTTTEPTKVVEETTAPATQPDTSSPKSDSLNEQGLAKKINDGAILHAWCWSFNTIKENLDDIAAAGYSAIQTSPVSQCKVGENGGMQLQDTESSKNKGKWYYHYQPTDYKIGNYQMGTEEEFKELCKEAKKHGIKIIVDAVVNHVSSDVTSVSNNIKTLTKEPFHNLGEITNYNDRKQVTQGDMLGLKDLNTQDEKVQEYILSYLKQCVADGASGFRYDGAKHIELSDDDKEYAGKFWDVVLNNGAEFQYGEILQGGEDRVEDYQKIMNVSASKYGESFRSALIQSKATASYFDYNIEDNMDENKLVTWVESHDNYCNDGTWQTLTEEDVTLAWAIIASRSGGTPLFFSRPMGSSITNQWGENKIGDAGSDFYKSKEVTEINKFRNAMIGVKDTISNPMENNAIMLVERGSYGAVFTNMSKEEIKLDCAIKLKDGKYKDKISGVDYTVKNNKITGTLPSRGIIILY